MSRVLESYEVGAGELRPEVQRFAEAMEAVLRAHDAAKGRELAAVGLAQAAYYLREETRELFDAEEDLIHEQEGLLDWRRLEELEGRKLTEQEAEHLRQLRHEAVDVANAALLMFLAVGRLLDRTEARG